MTSRGLITVFGFAFLAGLFSLSSPAHAVGSSEENDARDLLEKAWSPAGPPPSDADRTTLLKSAMKLLQNAPPGPGVIHRHNAINFIKSALFEISNGDPDHKVNEYIHSAVDEVRDLT